MLLKTNISDVYLFEYGVIFHGSNCLWKIGGLSPGKIMKFFIFIKNSGHEGIFVECQPPTFSPCRRRGLYSEVQLEHFWGRALCRRGTRTLYGRDPPRPPRQYNRLTDRQNWKHYLSHFVGGLWNDCSLSNQSPSCGSSRDWLEGEIERGTSPNQESPSCTEWVLQ